MPDVGALDTNEDGNGWNALLRRKPAPMGCAESSGLLGPNEDRGTGPEAVTTPFPQQGHDSTPAIQVAEHGSPSATSAAGRGFVVCHSDHPLFRAALQPKIPSAAKTPGVNQEGWDALPRSIPGPRSYAEASELLGLDESNEMDFEAVPATSLQCDGGVPLGGQFRRVVDYESSSDAMSIGSASHGNVGDFVSYWLIGFPPLLNTVLACQRVRRDNSQSPPR